MTQQAPEKEREIANTPRTEYPSRKEGVVETPDDSLSRRRTAALLSIIGAAAMGLGGAVSTSTGADLWGLVDGDVDVATYLAEAAGSVSTLHTAHAIWIVGVLVIALGGVLLTGRTTDAASTAARATYAIGAALAIPAFMTMIALTRLAESGTDAPALAEALAFLGARLDDVATIVIIGIGPVLIALASRKTWMPRWLARFAVLVGVAALVSAVSLFFGQAGSLGLLLVPIGIAWTISAGIVTLRRA